MKNPKILPFSDWFKVYEAAGRKFERSQRILENMTVGRLFESAISQTSMTIPEKFQKAGGSSLTVGDESFGDPLEIDTEKHNQFITKTNTILGEIPNFYFATGSDSLKIQKIKDNDQRLNIMKLILSGIGNNAGVENLASKLMDDASLMQDIGLKVSLVKTYSLPSIEGAVVNGKKLINIKSKYNESNLNANGKKVTSSTGTSRFYLCGYLNTVNVVNFAVGNNTQYVSLSMYENSDGFDIEMRGEADGNSVKESSGAIYLYAPSSVDESESTVETVTPPSPSGGAWINWKDLSSGYDEDGDVVYISNPDLKKFATDIIKNLGEKEVITKLQLTSTIGTTWKGVAVQPSTGTGKPSDTDQTEQMIAADKTELGNKWLAYLRGKTISDVLYSELGSRLQPNSIEIIWKVAAINSEKDNNISYNIIQKSPSNATIFDTYFVKKANPKEQSGGVKIDKYKISFDDSPLVGAKKSGLNKATGGVIGKTTVQYEDLKKGMIVKYKGKDDSGNVSDKIEKEGTVLSVDDEGIPTIKTPSGNKLVLNRSRFISGPKATTTVAEI